MQTILRAGVASLTEGSNRSIFVVVFDRGEDPTRRPFQRRLAARTDTSPAGAHLQRPAAGPLTAAGRPASLIREVEALMSVDRHRRLAKQPSAAGLRRSVRSQSGLFVHRSQG